MLVSQDRNRENVLVQRGEDNHVRLVPIDHGYILPRTLSFIREKKHCIEYFNFFGQDLPLTQNSLNWMRTLNRVEIAQKISGIQAVDQKTLEVIDFTATLLRCIGNNPFADRLLTSDLYQLFFDFEQKLRKMRLALPDDSSKEEINSTICLLTIVKELKQNEDLEPFCQRVMSLLIEKMVRTKMIL